MTEQEALSKIQKILNLASKNDNAHEASLALEGAHLLAKKYNLVIVGFTVTTKAKEKATSLKPNTIKQPKNVHLSHLANVSYYPRTIDRFLKSSGELDFVLSSRAVFIKKKFKRKLKLKRAPFYEALSAAFKKSGPSPEDVNRPIDLDFEHFILGLIYEVDRMLSYNEDRKIDTLFLNADEAKEKMSLPWFKQGQLAFQESPQLKGLFSGGFYPKSTAA